MLGALIGDIVGSRFEWHNHKTKDFELFTANCFPTDDSMMSLAVAEAILACSDNYQDLSTNVIHTMQDWGHAYPDAGYGGRFSAWLVAKDPKPYHSFGNGSAMRVSPCGFCGKNMQEVKNLALAVTEPTHNHPEGIKGAEATAATIYLARTGHKQKEIRDYINSHYYKLNFTLDQIRPTYAFHETCQESVPQALEAFLEAHDFEDTIRNAISIGGDSDTIAAIAGSIASAYFGIPDAIRQKALTYLDTRQLNTLTAFEERFEKKEQ